MYFIGLLFVDFKTLAQEHADVEFKMQDRLKKAEELQAEIIGQVIKQLGPWFDMAKVAKDQVQGQIQSQIQSRLADKGIALRWPAVLGLIQDLAPQLPLNVISEIWHKTEPLSRWFKFELRNLGPETLELVTEPRPENLKNDMWDPLVFSALGSRVIEMMIERHAPPGHLVCDLKKMELEMLTESAQTLHFRSYWASIEIEGFVRELNAAKELEIQLPVKVLSPDEVGVANLIVTYKVKLQPLLRA